MWKPRWRSPDDRLIDDACWLAFKNDKPAAIGLLVDKCRRMEQDEAETIQNQKGDTYVEKSV